MSLPGRDGHHRRHEATRRHRAPIHLPPLSSPRDGPRHGETGSKPSACHMGPSRGGYQPSVTPEGGYGLRRAPECLEDNVRHRPTIHRPLRCPPTSRRDFGPPSSGPNGIRPRGDALRRSSGRVGRPSPGLEPVAVPRGRGRALYQTQPTVDGLAAMRHRIQRWRPRPWAQF